MVTTAFVCDLAMLHPVTDRCSYLLTGRAPFDFCEVVVYVRAHSDWNSGRLELLWSVRVVSSGRQSSEGKDLGVFVLIVPR